MNSLRNNIHLLSFLRNICKVPNTDFYTHSIINNNPITNNTISIVMTSHERSQQVYFTLDTINKSNYKDIQVIIVDDSTNDPVDINILKKYSFNIEFISIITQHKFWANPCINYNIGFMYIKGTKLIIQNGEVCHVGDVIEYVNKNVIDNTYHVFDVKTSFTFEENNNVYNSIDKLDINFVYNKISGEWYQHTQYRNVKYHFLTALTVNTFKRIEGFSYDYSFGASFDDDDLLLKIQELRIPIFNVNSIVYGIVGIHLYHGYEKNISDVRAYRAEYNGNLFNKKRNYLHRNNKYIELSSLNTLDEMIENYNMLLNVY
jgi:hypothetical protein